MSARDELIEAMIQSFNDGWRRTFTERAELALDALLARRDLLLEALGAVQHRRLTVNRIEFDQWRFPLYNEAEK